MIQKQRPPGHYTMIGNEVFRDTRLNLADRGLLSTLLSLPDAWSFTIAGLMTILPDGKSRIRQSLKKLEDLGYLTIIQGRNGNGEFVGNTIEVRNQPKTPLSENPTAVNPPTVNPTAVDPMAEKPSEYKIDKYKTVLDKKNNNNKTKYSFQDFEQRSYSQDFYEQLEEKMGSNTHKKLSKEDAAT